MVRDGSDVRVVDGRTGKDVTHIILTQIIAENAKERQIALPLQLLTQIVRASDKATHDFLSWYLNSTLDLYQKAQNSFNMRLSKAKNAASTPLDYVRNLLAAYRGHRPRRAVKSSNFAAALRNCRRAWRGQEIRRRAPRRGHRA